MDAGVIAWVVAGLSLVALAIVIGFASRTASFYLKSLETLELDLARLRKEAADHIEELRHLRNSLDSRVKEETNRRMASEYEREREIIVSQLREKAQLDIEAWRRAEEKRIRLDAVLRSNAVTVGKFSEHLLPFGQEFPWNPKDARFIGSPVDFLVFDGLDEGNVREIVVVEVKTNASRVSTRQQQVKSAIEDGRVKWKLITIQTPAVEQTPLAVENDLSDKCGTDKQLEEWKRESQKVFDAFGNRTVQKLEWEIEMIRKYGSRICPHLAQLWLELEED